MKIISEKVIGEKTIRLVQGDITERNVDAIVNAAILIFSMEVVLLVLLLKKVDRLYKMKVTR